MLDNNVKLAVLRLLRHLQYSQTPLSCLNLWCLILLVHQCQNESTNSIAHVFRTVFSCLSSGLLLPNALGPGIIDPCEKDLVDAASYLTVEQRISITTYAQWIVRCLAFKQYNQIFDHSIQARVTHSIVADQSTK
jgi:zinc finger RNA-binding protein